MMKCSYCKQDWKADEYNRCSYCGAVKPEPETIERWEPFFYEGFIVYSLVNRPTDSYEFIFYKGVELIVKITISCQEIRDNVPEGCAYMPYVMSKMEITEVPQPGRLMLRGIRDKVEWFSNA